MNLTSKEIELRTPLWIALADLMLDTDLPGVWAKNIAEAMRSNQFTLLQTKAIYLNEVGPAFAFNLFAWEWQGWEESFVKQQVSHFIQRRKLQQYFLPIVLKKLLKAQWESVLPHLQRELCRDGFAEDNEV